MTSVITSVALTAAGECAEAQLVGVIKYVIKKGSRNGPVQLALVSVTRPFPTVIPVLDPLTGVTCRLNFVLLYNYSLGVLFRVLRSK